MSQTQSRSGPDAAAGARLAWAHRLLCAPLIDEAAFRGALGGGRADLGTVARYLALPAARRPPLTPFLDPLFYRVRNPELPAEEDPLLHFLEHGIADGRDPHALIDLRHIAAQAGLPPPAMTPDALAALLAGDRIDPSPYFDVAFYAGQLQSPARGMLAHFLLRGAAAGLLPNRWLDPAWYAGAHDDVPAEPLAALRHFVLVGDPLGRAASKLFDGGLYRRRYTDVAEAGAPPLWHFLAHGRAEGRQTASDRSLGPPPIPGAMQPDSPVAGNGPPLDPARINLRYALLERRWADRNAAARTALRPRRPAWLQVTDPAAALAEITLPPWPAAPRLSVLIPAHDEAAQTVACLLALVRHPPGCTFEVLLADDGSTEKLFSQLRRVPHLVVRRSARNRGFVAACNDAWAQCRGAYVLLLNNDAQVQPGAIDALLGALDGDPSIAACGGRLVYPDGLLQEAGCALRPDGESVMVGLFGNADDPCYGFDRDVPYCSGAALMLRRAAVGEALFDPAYAPAYCEDADLCLRLHAAGHRVRYVAGATVAHRLSASADPARAAARLRRIAGNQATLQARWGERLAELDQVRPIAFYLPQFHPTPENDAWWGAGFTEWHNVARAQPSYAGHYQPHLPADLGFYDLRVPDVLRQQALLAARYGVEGFCVYHYDFGDRRLLDAPMRALLADPAIPFHHCLCWANENFTRNWDGGSREILVEQRYDEPTIARVIADVVTQARDPRSIRVRGCPLFLVYRPLLLPDPAAFAARLRAALVAAGFPGGHLAYVESMEAAGQLLMPAEIGFNAAVEFPPHGRAIPATDAVEVLKPGWTGYRYDYDASVLAFLERPGVAWRRYPAVFPGWDNTPRQPMRGTSFDDASPEAFRFAVERKIDQMRGFLAGEERLLFVNAWNEWAEGAHLEPDSGFGHRWLEALRDALEARRWH
jgi:GT2 family glycosyltransferase